MSSPHKLHDKATAENFYDDRYAQGYMDEWPKEKCERISALLRQLPIPPRGRALDFGCGTGVFTATLNSTLSNWVIEGTDLSVNAIEAARKRLPGCSFYPLAECSSREPFDLIFTHHVLEHVSDLAESARFLAQLAKPKSAMFHILPCANDGSFERAVCLLRKDGIRKEGERRFFYEEEGHLRRLDTAGLTALWAPDRFILTQAWYSGHCIGAIDSWTMRNWSDIRNFADPQKGVDTAAGRKLALIRLVMIVLWTLRRPVIIFNYKKKFGCRSLKDVFLFGSSLLVYPFAGVLDAGMKLLARNEWNRRQADPGGSEMYICLARE
jgi:SAM-dependent methyltransferase